MYNKFENQEAAVHYFCSILPDYYNRLDSVKVLVDGMLKLDKLSIMLAVASIKYMHDKNIPVASASDYLNAYQMESMRLFDENALFLSGFSDDKQELCVCWLLIDSILGNSLNIGCINEGLTDKQVFFRLISCLTFSGELISNEWISYVYMNSFYRQHSLKETINTLTELRLFLPRDFVNLCGEIANGFFMHPKLKEVVNEYLNLRPAAMGVFFELAAKLEGCVSPNTSASNSPISSSYVTNYFSPQLHRHRRLKSLLVESRECDSCPSSPDISRMRRARSIPEARIIFKDCEESDFFYRRIVNIW